MSGTNRRSCGLVGRPRPADDICLALDLRRRLGPLARAGRPDISTGRQSSPVTRVPRAPPAHEHRRTQHPRTQRLSAYQRGRPRLRHAAQDDSLAARIIIRRCPAIRSPSSPPVRPCPTPVTTARRARQMLDSVRPREPPACSRERPIERLASAQWLGEIRTSPGVAACAGSRQLCDRQQQHSGGRCRPWKRSGTTQPYAMTAATKPRRGGRRNRPASCQNWHWRCGQSDRTGLPNLRRRRNRAVSCRGGPRTRRPQSSNWHSRS